MLAGSEGNNRYCENAISAKANTEIALSAYALDEEEGLGSVLALHDTVKDR